MIENSERGITINKSLAWTVFTAVLAGGIWIGIEINAARQGIEALTLRQSEDRADIRENTKEIVTLRSSGARVDQRLMAIEQSARRTEDTLTEILRYLREGGE